MNTIYFLGSRLINSISLAIALNFGQSGRTTVALVSNGDLEWQARKRSTHWIAKDHGGFQ
jgi:hypothetical protein